MRPKEVELSVVANPDDQARQQDALAGKFDIVEFYTGRYIADLAARTLGFTAIPIFVKRMFRHSYIYVNKHSNLRSPAGLHGKRVGLLTWCNSAAIWARGMLADEFAVDLQAIKWVVGWPDSIPNWKPPSWANLEFVPEGRRDLFKLLATREIDAAITTEMFAPNCNPDVEFLFRNYGELERAYYRKTGFFPIHHTLLIRNSVLRENPWVAMSIFNACQESKRRCYEWLEWQRIHQTSLWYRALWEEEQAAGGTDFYKWGFKESRPELDKLLTYCQRDGVTPRKFAPEEMFWETTLDT